MQAGIPTLPLHNGTNFRVDQPYLYKMEYTSDWASTISFSNGQFISAFNIVTGLVLMYTQVLSTYLHGSHLHTQNTLDPLCDRVECIVQCSWSAPGTTTLSRAKVEQLQSVQVAISIGKGKVMCSKQIQLHSSSTLSSS